MPRKLNANQKYWIGRSEETVVDAEKEALKLEQRIRKASKAVIARVESEIELFYKRYAVDNSISLSDARLRLTPKEAQNFRALNEQFANRMQREGKDWFGSNSKSANKARRQAENMSKRLYITRLQALQRNIMRAVDELCVEYEYDLGETMADVHVESFNKTQFNIQKNIALGYTFDQPGKNQLRAACKMKYDGRNYSDSIWQDRELLARQLETLLTREFVSGQGSAKVSRELKHRLELMYGRPVKQSHATRLIRTEINYIANQGTKRAYKDTGFIQEYEYLATLDSVTSKVCAVLDDTKFPLKEATVGVNYPPMHANCRSTTIPYFEDDKIDDRVHRDSDGKSVKLGENMSYKQWSKIYAPERYKKYFS